MQRHSESRFDEIYQSHREEIARYIRRRVSAEAVEDLLSETFLVCWRKLDEVPPQPLPWLYAVARKTLANHYRATAPYTARAGCRWEQLHQPELWELRYSRRAYAGPDGGRHDLHPTRLVPGRQ